MESVKIALQNSLQNKRNDSQENSQDGCLKEKKVRSALSQSKYQESTKIAPQSSLPKNSNDSPEQNGDEFPKEMSRSKKVLQPNAKAPPPCGMMNIFGKVNPQEYKRILLCSYSHHHTSHWLTVPSC